MLRSPLRRALAVLSLAIPAGCGDDGTGASTGGATETSTGGTTETGGGPPTSGEPTTGVGTGGTVPTEPTSSDPSASGTGTEGSASGSSTGGSGATTGDGINQSPFALGDKYIAKAKQPLVVGPGMGLLANDVDPDGDALSLVAADPLTQGQAQLTAMQDGSFTYQPPPSLWGRDSFGYKIWDGLDGFAETQVRVDVNPTAIDVEYVAAGKGGFAIDGESPGHYSGRSVHAVGDLDGDGMDEVVVAARNADMNAGRIYVVFGKYTNDPIALSKLAEQQKGYVIHGELAGDFAGTTVAGAGDVDGDGKEDIIIGAPKASPNGKSSGKAYVALGKADSEPQFLDLIGSGNGGFALHGEKMGDAAGRSVAGAGDVNGDGLADLIVGAYGADPGGSFSGATYVVFGHGADKPTELSTIALGQGGGYVINGEVSLDFSGFSVAGAGDVNGDGLDDVVIGAYGNDVAGDGAGRAYVVFGKASASSVLLTDVAAGQGGFGFDGGAAYDRAGFAVAGAGDFDGDGFADMVFGSPLADAGGEDSGRAYVVFGGPGLKSGSLTAVASGATGVTLDGVLGRDYAGTSVAPAGDVDADGHDDLMIGAPGANPHGGDSGRAYVVFGDPSAVSGSLQQMSFGDGGFTLDGEAGDDYCGFSVASGDINGDGHSDLITGARGNDGKGDDAGRTYVVFGGDYTNVVFQVPSLGPDKIDGSPMGESLVGGRGGDLITAKGADAIYGGAGDDEIHAEDLQFVRIDGGAGQDILRLLGGGQSLDLTARSDLDLVDVETIDLGGVDNKLELAWRDVRALAPRGHVLTIAGMSGAVTVDLKGAGFTDAGVKDGFHVYQHPVYTLRIAMGLQATVAL